MKTAEIKINGMTCNHCTGSVQSAITLLNGVSSVDMSLEKGTATVEYDETQTSMDIFKNVIEDIGFSVV